MNKALILVVEDDRPIRNLIVTTLKTHDYKYLTAENGASAIMETSSHNPDIVLLDLGLPDMEGVEVIKKIRTWSNLPIIVVSARSEDTDKIEALDAGADDYITKPFSLPEVAARISAHLRREARTHDSSRLLASQELLVNLSRRTVHFKGTEIEFSKREFDILELLLTHAGQVFDRERIYESVWRLDASGDSGVVKEHIRKIRQKLQNVAGEDYIETVWGVGYRWKQ